MSDILIETQYLPSIEFFAAIYHTRNLRIERHENFQKQTYRNRCYILGANNIQVMTVPVIRPGGKIPIRDLKIDNSQRWNHEHWTSIKSAYGKAPFFEYFSEEFFTHFKNPPSFLLDFNYNLLTLCLKLLQIDMSIHFTEKYVKHPDKGIIDLRSRVNPKELYSRRPFYKAEPYFQAFGKDFVANMSVIDLLMNEGTNASRIVTKSVKTE